MARLTQHKATTIGWIILLLCYTLVISPKSQTLINKGFFLVKVICT